MEIIKVTSKLCMVKDVGLNGNLFGGNMLAWADEAATIFAKDYTGMPYIVTKHINEVDFKLPVKTGVVVDFWVTNIIVGDSSITFSLVAYDNTNRDKVYLNTKFTMVAVGLDGKRTPIKTNYRWRQIREELSASGRKPPITATFEYVCHLYTELFAKPLPPIKKEINGTDTIS